MQMNTKAYSAKNKNTQYPTMHHNANLCMCCLCLWKTKMVTINSPSEENNQQKVCNSSFSSERARKRNIMIVKQRRED